MHWILNIQKTKKLKSVLIRGNVQLHIFKNCLIYQSYMILNEIVLQIKIKTKENLVV